MTPSALAERVKTARPGAINLTIDGLGKSLWDYQVNDVAWMIAQRTGLLGHEVGTGKTVFGIALAQWLKNRGQLGGGMVVFCTKQAGVLVRQWMDELRIWAPDLDAVTAVDMAKADRHRLYQSQWDVLVVNYEVARNDAAAMRAAFVRRKPTVLYCDEASAFRNERSKISELVRSLTPLFPFRFAATGTPIETGVEDLWGIMVGIGLKEVVGDKASFMRTFTIREKREFRVKGGRKMSKLVVTGYQNLGQLREMIGPWHIRRTVADPEVARHLPTVQPLVLRPMMPALQARTYSALKKGTLKKMDGEWKVSMNKVKGPWIRLLGAADGTQTLDPEMADASGKSDWLIEALTTGQFADEKVLVFSRFVRSMWPLEKRLAEAGIGYGKFFGSSWQSDKERQADVDRFKTDPDCRVLLATSAVEKGLNLQVARVVVFYGIVPNPARLEQVMGRIRRGGSEHASVYAVTLLSRDTVEEPLWDVVLERNAVKDFVWEEESVLFDRLGPEKLAELIAS